MTRTPPSTPSPQTPAGTTSGPEGDAALDAATPLAVDPALAELPQHLALVCSQFARLAARRSEVGVGSVSWRVVATIERFGPLRLSEIAERERVSRPTATTVIKRLEEEGLVRREADPTDSRSWLVSTTEAGSAQLAAWRGQLATGVGTLLEPLPEEDLATLARASELLARILESHDG
ncbi:MarR family winged helix-turn-helix transcriptional regulator [Brachybacterium conglomeratum]|uniref:MarR family winged helix-turn-helix transcriptional regulator n=1 Tax=Brachybacterium conglomeratum TaxID=47846 RepID=UPI003DA12738